MIWAFRSIGCTLIGDAVEEPDTPSFLFSVAFEELTVVIIFWLNIWFIPAALEKGSLFVGVFTNRFSFEELAVVPDMMEAVLAMAARAMKI